MVHGTRLVLTTSVPVGEIPHGQMESRLWSRLPLPAVLALKALKEVMAHREAMVLTVLRVQQDKTVLKVHREYREKASQEHKGQPDKMVVKAHKEMSAQTALKGLLVRRAKPGQTALKVPQDRTEIRAKSARKVRLEMTAVRDRKAIPDPLA